MTSTLAPLITAHSAPAESFDRVDLATLPMPPAPAWNAFGKHAILDDPYSSATCLIAFGKRVQRAMLVQQRGSLWGLRASALAPLRAVRDASAALRKHAEQVKAEEGISSLTQFAWASWLMFRHGYDEDSIYLFTLFDRSRTLPMPLFASRPLGVMLCRTVLPWIGRAPADILGDKRRFAEWCAAHDVPSPQILMEIDAGEVIHSHIETGGPRTDLFAKWATNYGGKNTSCWRYESVSGEGGRYIDEGGRSHSFDELVSRLVEQSRQGPVILQRRLRNHVALSGISGNALNTLRIMTTQRPGAAPQFLVGMMRIATGDSTVDNISQGGIGSSVDFDTGILLGGRSADNEYRTRVYPDHPVTGNPIRSVQLPFWKEAVDLTVRAHALLGDIPCIGWDVAILDDGPVLVEGNWNPGVRLVQRTTQVPLLATEFAGAYAAWLESPRCQFDDAWLAAHVDWSPV